MSLVGPRPEVPFYTDRYSSEQREILGVRPGITSFASVVFSDEEQVLAAQKDKEFFYVTQLMPYKIALDLQHCRRVTLAADLRILLHTALKLFGRRNAAVAIPTSPANDDSSPDQPFSGYELKQRI
jgi:lipopolysaccharide/colanic/teichoic acid biosynthesis glycosyltransferase